MLMKNCCPEEKSSSKARQQHPDYSLHLRKLNIAGGQIEGIRKMITERRYCPEIIVQLKAVRSALKGIESEIFKTHLKGCVKTAIKSNNGLEAETKIEEILKMVYGKGKA